MKARKSPEELKEASKERTRAWRKANPGYQKQWRLDNPDKKYRKKRGTWLKRVYGLTEEEWNQLFESQGSVCAICKSPDHSGQGWQTDHCHSTGKVRGILCVKCNLALGYLKDDVTSLHEAISYLEKVR